MANYVIFFTFSSGCTYSQIILFLLFCLNNNENLHELKNSGVLNKRNAMSPFWYNAPLNGSVRAGSADNFYLSFSSEIMLIARPNKMLKIYITICSELSKTVLITPKSGKKTYIPSNTDGTLQSHLVNTDGALQSHLVNTHGALQSHLVNTDGALQSHLVNTDGALQSHLVYSDGALQSHLVNTDGALQDGAGHDGALAADAEAVVHREDERLGDGPARQVHLSAQLLHQLWHACSRGKSNNYSSVGAASGSRAAR